MFFGRQTSKLKDSKIALDSRIEVHDKSQFEVKFDYNFLNSLSAKDTRKEKSIQLKLIFLFPKISVFRQLIIPRASFIMTCMPISGSKPRKCPLMK